MALEPLAKVMDDVSRDAAMIAVALRRRDKGESSTQELADDLTGRWDRILDSLTKARDMVNGEGLG